MMTIILLGAQKPVLTVLQTEKTSAGIVFAIGCLPIVLAPDRPSAVVPDTDNVGDVYILEVATRAVKSGEATSREGFP